MFYPRKINESDAKRRSQIYKTLILHVDLSFFHDKLFSRIRMKEKGCTNIALKLLWTTSVFQECDRESDAGTVGLPLFCTLGTLLIVCSDCLKERTLRVDDYTFIKKLFRER